MGGKSTWRWKYLLVYLACIILFWGSGCAPTEKRIERVELGVSTQKEQDRASPASGRPGGDEKPKPGEGGREEAKALASGPSLHKARRLLHQGNYEGALRESERVLSVSNGKPPADEALFSMGVVYAHPRNPKKDYQKAIAFFKRLIREHPESPWAQEAEVWNGILQENEKLLEMIEKTKQVDIEVEEKKRKKTK